MVKVTDDDTQAAREWLKTCGLDQYEACEGTLAALLAQTRHDAVTLGRAKMRYEAGEACLQSRQASAPSAENNIRVDCHDRIHRLPLTPGATSPEAEALDQAMRTLLQTAGLP